ncbi:MAG TPA: bacillithiol biosynthesis BshC, partial [Thermoanaerobaculia bacterium]|nr:bacillithiol biosynthesis BshC [Thermoanaerobaculia bacterium]
AGTPVTAFFWLATEDHDFDEVAHLSVAVPSATHRQLDLMSLRTTRSGDSRAAVGPQRIPEPLIAELLALLHIERPQWLRPGITFGDSFAELISTVFGSEIVLVDALLPELRRAGAPLFANIFRSWSAIEQTLADRSADLRQAGYTPQVVPRDGEAYSLLFDLDDRFNRRLIVEPRDTVEEPERISTSALTRPLLQDFVLRPDVFVGGPAEVAYYAQISPLHELLGVDMPRVALRGHVLLVPKRSLRFMERFDVRPEELFTSPDALLAERDPQQVEEVKKEAAVGRRQLIERIERIGELALPADHALARAISRSIGHIEYHFDKFTERAIRGLVRKDRERYAAAKELAATLYPDRHVQDRIVAWLPFWLQHETHLVETVVEAIQPDAPAFEIIGL